MNTRWYTMAMAMLFFGLSAGAQSVEKRIDQLYKDPKTEESRARADVYITGKKIMPDSMQQGAQKASAIPGKKKKKSCKKHS